MSESVYFVSLGCPKNLVDSQVMLGALDREKYRITREPKDADLVIVNTCSFIEASKEESIDTLLELADLKTTGRCKTLVASGCLVQRYVDRLAKEMPEIDLFIGTGQYHRITEALAKRATGALPARAYVDQPAFLHSENDPRVLTGPPHAAFLKLSEGCNRRCSFCIIPKLRGNVRSRSIASLVEETKRLAGQGARELSLVAQDLTEYGMEGKYRENLEKLLPRLCQVEGIEWIRLHYVYPDQFSEGLIEVLVSEPKIVKYLDMPIQHTSDRILGAMNRRLTKDRLFSLVERLRARAPGLAIRTSIIVGFPGETDADFDELRADLAQLDLEHVGVFRYSREEGTPAAELPGQIKATVKRARERELRAELALRAGARARAKVGARARAIVDGPSDETDLLWEARLPTQAREIDGKLLLNDLGGRLSIAPGDFVEVELTETLPPHDFLARVCEDGMDAGRR